MHLNRGPKSLVMGTYIFKSRTFIFIFNTFHKMEPKSFKVLLLEPLYKKETFNIHNLGTYVLIN